MALERVSTSIYSEMSPWAEAIWDATVDEKDGIITVKGTNYDGAPRVLMVQYIGRLTLVTRRDG